MLLAGLVWFNGFEDVTDTRRWSCVCNKSIIDMILDLVTSNWILFVYNEYSPKSLSNWLDSIMRPIYTYGGIRRGIIVDCHHEPDRIELSTFPLAVIIMFGWIWRPPSSSHVRSKSVCDPSSWPFDIQLSSSLPLHIECKRTSCCALPSSQTGCSLGWSTIPSSSQTWPLCTSYPSRSKEYASCSMKRECGHQRYIIHVPSSN